MVGVGKGLDFVIRYGGQGCRYKYRIEDVDLLYSQLYWLFWNVYINLQFYVSKRIWQVHLGQISTLVNQCTHECASI